MTRVFFRPKVLRLGRMPMLILPLSEGAILWAGRLTAS